MDFRDWTIQLKLRFHFLKPITVKSSFRPEHFTRRWQVVQMNCVLCSFANIPNESWNRISSTMLSEHPHSVRWNTKFVERRTSARSRSSTNSCLSVCFQDFHVLIEFLQCCGVPRWKGNSLTEVKALMICSITGLVKLSVPWSSETSNLLIWSSQMCR